ncbi:hypothetical protein FQZ97_746720 [compost metagenome]
MAAHECRDTRRARLIGTSALTPRWEERLVPGVSEDVGGGLRQEDAPHSRELHLASLHEMYRAAYRAGVPFPALDELHEIDTKAADLFNLYDHINGTSALDAAKGYSAAAGFQKPDADAFLAHRRLYIRRLRGLWQLYHGQDDAYYEEEERLQRPFLGNEGSLASFLGFGGEPAEQTARREKRLQEVRRSREGLRQEFGWLHAVASEANRSRYGLTTDAERVLLSEWFFAPSTGTAFVVEDLLEFYLNDRHMISRMPPEDSTRKYFRVRAFDRPDPMKTKGFLPPVPPLSAYARG